MEKTSIVNTILAAASEAEILHRKAQVVERYGQAAYHQGLRDGLRAAAEVVRAGGPVEQPAERPEVS